MPQTGRCGATVGIQQCPQGTSLLLVPALPSSVTGMAPAISVLMQEEEAEETGTCKLPLLVYWPEHVTGVSFRIQVSDSQWSPLQLV